MFAELLLMIYFYGFHLMPVFAVLLLLGSVVVGIFKLRSPSFRRKVWITTAIVTIIGIWGVWATNDLYARKRARIEKTKEYQRYLEKKRAQEQ